MARPSRRSQKCKQKKNAQGAGPASEALSSAEECALMAQECCNCLDYAEASKHYARAAKLEPGDAMRHADHAYALGLAADRHADALRLCERELARPPQCQSTRAQSFGVGWRWMAHVPPRHALQHEPAAYQYRVSPAAYWLMCTGQRLRAGNC